MSRTFKPEWISMTILHLVQRAQVERFLPFALLYIGPETILPLTSVLAAIVGFLLIVWRHAVALASRLWRFVARKPSGELTETVVDTRK
jgi:hypothetical protein